MNPEEFRRYGHEVVDWIADYSAHIRDYPVLAQIQPGDLIDALPASGPEQGEPMDAILADFRRLIVPAVTHWNHPRFFAFFPNSSTGPGILGELLAAALNLNGMIWKSAPAVTELEQVTLDWLRQWLGLRRNFFGSIFDTASIGSLHAIVAAREAALPEGRHTGNWERLVLYCSEHAHSSIEKGALAAGIRIEHVRKIPADAEFRMRTDALAEAVARDRQAGLLPFCVVATIGTTSMTSIDPVEAIADIAAANKLWLHVDGAYGGSAAIVPSMRHVLAGVDRADSFVMNPHKWLLTPVDLSALFIANPEAFQRAFSLIPEYLRTEPNPRMVNRMDYGIPLGRRFRALKLWFVMRYYGREGIAAVIERHMRDAAELASWIRADPRFEVCAPVLFSLVCFRYRGSDEQNARLLDEINRSGFAFLSRAVIGGRTVLRLAVGNHATGIEDLREVWDRIGAAAGRFETGQGA